MDNPVYRTTEAGRLAWESQDTAVPADYRLMLWLIDFHGHDYIKSLVGRFPADLLPAWLEEMEQLGLIERGEPRAIVPDEGDTTAAFSQRHLARLSKEVEEAGRSLTALGAFLAEHRLAQRPALAKRAEEIVILIVDDDPDQLALADLRVTMAGYRVRVANSLSAMHQSLAYEGAPDLVLLDVMLPDGDGFEILQKLRRHPIYAPIPVVMLTAKNDSEDIGLGLRLGADGYITKPYTKAVLANVVSRVLKR
jgi:two-component system, OmpR family, response regulator